MTQEDAKNFNLARKYKINQQILDGFLDASEAISAPSVFVSTFVDGLRRRTRDLHNIICLNVRLLNYGYYK